MSNIPFTPATGGTFSNLHYVPPGVSAGARSAADRLGEVLSPKDFGAKGDGTTDDQSAFGAVATAVNDRNGGYVRWTPDTYMVYATSTLGASQTLMAFTDCDGIVLDGCGATINIQDTFAGTEQASIFDFERCKNIVIRNFVFSHTALATPFATAGAHWCDFTDTCENILIENCRVESGFTFVRCVRDPNDAETEKCQNITVLNAYCQDVGYPLSFQQSGDNVFVRNLHIDRCGRAYFPYGVRNHDIALNLRDGGISPTCDLSVFDTNSTTNYLEDIKLHVTCPDTTTGVNIVGLVFLHNAGVSPEPTGGAAMRNIDIHINYVYNDAAALHAAVALEKVISGAGADTAARGYVLENVTISGNVSNQNDGGNIINFQATGDMGAETMRNIMVRDFRVTGTGETTISFDGDPFEDALVLENVQIDGGTASTFSNTWAKGVVMRNTRLANVDYINSVTQSLELTIATGAVTAFAPYHTIDTESDAASDNLSTINGDLAEGTVLVIRAENSARTVTVDQTGNIDLSTTTFDLDHIGDSLTLVKGPANWHEVARANNA